MRTDEAIFGRRFLQTSAVPVAGYFNFTYNRDDDRNITECLNKVMVASEITNSTNDEC